MKCTYCGKVAVDFCAACAIAACERCSMVYFNEGEDGKMYCYDCLSSGEDGSLDDEETEEDK